MRLVLRAVAAAALALATSSNVLAQAAPSDGDRAERPHEALRGDPSRPLPDYDGRADPAPTVDDALLWVPRILFFPLHLVIGGETGVP